jgi:Ohr subfamily peroxiredoxin
MMKNVYTARATAVGGRGGGTARTDDGALDVTIVSPKEMGGTGAPGTNPEQLFAVGYSSCFLGAVKHVARKAGVKPGDDWTVTAEVSFLDREDDVGFWISAALKIKLGDLDKPQAEDLVRKAHEVCPYSEASRKGFNVTLDVI